MWDSRLPENAVCSVHKLTCVWINAFLNHLIYISKCHPLKFHTINVCSVAIRRMRAYYRGLGTGPAATPVLRAFARNTQTINSCNRDIYRSCCGALFCKGANSMVANDMATCPWEIVGVPFPGCRLSVVNVSPTCVSVSMNTTMLMYWSGNSEVL